MTDTNASDDTGDQVGDQVDDLEAEWREAGFTLARPIPRKGDDPVERVEFFSPYTGMLKVMDEHRGQVAGSMALIARMTNLSPADVHKMHPRDFGRCSEVAQRFFGDFLQQETAPD